MNGPDMSDITDSSSSHMNEELFQLFATLIYNHAGIRLNEQKKTLLVSRLQKRIRSLGCAGYHDYYKRVKVDEDERVMMLNCISTNTTKFFRENHHFEFLRDTLIPGLIESRDTQKELRIWSAGCSTGEEPYSIAISISEAFRDMFQNWDPIDPYCGWSVKILATDISTNVLNRAQERSAIGRFLFRRLNTQSFSQMVAAKVVV